MVSVIECLQQTWLTNVLIPLVIWSAASLILIIILLSILFKVLSKDKNVGGSNGTTKD